MPDEYIKVEDAIKAILGLSIYDCLDELEGARTIAENTWADGLWDAITALCEMDTANVAPVKHGKWVSDKWGDHYCSCCGEYAIDRGEFDSGDILTDYCPHCGAKMDEKDGGDGDA